MRRLPPVAPRPPLADTTVSVIVPTLNEAGRLAPCLAGLRRQDAPLLEVIIVDSGSTDGTLGLAREAATLDARIRVTSDPPLPAGWIGKVWALQHGLGLARGDWVLGVDADTEPNPGMVAGAVAAARMYGLDLVSFAPMFADQSAAERWLQPSLLASLVYRTGAPSARPSPDRLLANGQCFLVRRDVLLAHGGYAPARASFADDVFLARHYARAGVPCGFLDGRLLYRVRAYRSAAEMWREWGRSVDLADLGTRGRQAIEVLFLALVQGLPVPLLAAVVAGLVAAPLPLIQLNAGLLAVRMGLLVALAPSYERRGLPFALSWLTDPAAVLRVALSSVRRPVSWRGRSYRGIDSRQGSSPGPTRLAGEDSGHESSGP